MLIRDTTSSNIHVWIQLQGQVWSIPVQCSTNRHASRMPKTPSLGHKQFLLLSLLFGILVGGMFVQCRTDCYTPDLTLL